MVKHFLYCSALICAMVSAAQRVGQQSPAISALYQIPPGLPGGSPEKQMPPDTQAPPPATLSSEQVEILLANLLSSAPALVNSNVTASVDDRSIVLSGSVTSDQQRKVAIRIAESYAEARSIVDNIKTDQTFESIPPQKNM
jgi:hypothetical protein